MVGGSGIAAAPLSFLRSGGFRGRSCGVTRAGVVVRVTRRDEMRDCIDIWSGVGSCSRDVLDARLDWPTRLVGSTGRVGSVGGVWGCVWGLGGAVWICGLVWVGRGVGWWGYPSVGRCVGHK